MVIDEFTVLASDLPNKLIILDPKIPLVVCFLAWASDRATRRLRAATCGSTPATDPHLSWPNKSRASPAPLATTAPQQHSMAPAPEKPRERDPRRARARAASERASCCSDDTMMALQVAGCALPPLLARRRRRAFRSPRAVASDAAPAAAREEDGKVALGGSGVAVTKLGIGAWSWGDTTYWNEFQWDGTCSLLLATS